MPIVKEKLLEPMTLTVDLEIREILDQVSIEDNVYNQGRPNRSYAARKIIRAYGRGRAKEAENGRNTDED